MILQKSYFCANLLIKQLLFLLLKTVVLLKIFEGTMLHFLLNV